MTGSAPSVFILKQSRCGLVAADALTWSLREGDATISCRLPVPVVVPSRTEDARPMARAAAFLSIEKPDFGRQDLKKWSMDVPFYKVLPTSSVERLCQAIGETPQWRTPEHQYIFRDCGLHVRAKPAETSRAISVIPLAPLSAVVVPVIVWLQ